MIVERLRTWFRLGSGQGEDRYRRMVELCPDPMVVHCQGTIVYANQAAMSFVGTEDVVGRSVLDFVLPEHHEQIAERVANPDRAGALIEVDVLRADGDILQAECSSMPIEFDGQPATQVVLRDVTERKRVEDTLAYQAQHDALTGLPNRTLLLRKLGEAIEQQTPVALALLDLDRFKEVNDTLGHPAGDALLQQVASRLRGALRGAICISRLGGDEFAAILSGDDAQYVASVGHDLVRLFETPCQLEGQPVVVGASIGVALYPEHGQQPDTLLRRADVAMYVAKRGGSGVAFYDAHLDQYSPDRLMLIGDLRRAVEDGELVLHYQPKVDLRTRTLVGVEALVRWQHPLRGLISPDQFVPVAEQAGLIDPLSQWVLRAAMRQVRAWRRTGLEIPVAINLSARNLHDQHLPDTIAEHLEAHDLPASLFGVEITESTLMADPDRALEVLARLRAMGVSVGIDDFGTGHSSLAYLKRLPVDELKIDRAFVRDLLTDRGDRLIVRAILDLADGFGLRVVAEGVEDELTQRLLLDLGCNVAQGYSLSRPLRANQVTQWLYEQSPLAEAAAA